MPALSKSQRRWAGGWEHNPNQMTGKKPDMTKKQLHDFASTKEKGLVERKSSKRR
jgi:hypothetical protein